MLATCSNGTPTIAATITTLTNEQPDFLLSEGNTILWRNSSASSNAIPSTFSAQAHFKIKFDVSIPEETISVTQENF